MKITLFIPVRNEIDGVKEIMPRVNKDWVDEIIVIDGNSTDGTREYFETHGYTIYQQKNINQGAIGAWWEGFKLATGDIIIPFSPDGNSIPEVIPQLVTKINEGFDMVIASRYKGDAKSDDDTVLTAFGNMFFTKMINILFRVNYTDTLVMYRAFRAELLSSLKFDKENKELLFEILVSIRCAKSKLNVTEIAASEPMRIGGGDSRAHPGYYYKLKAGLVMLYLILREFIFWKY